MERFATAVAEDPTVYHYNLNGSLDAVTQSNGVTADYVYDGLNRLEELYHFLDADADHAYDVGETLIASFDYHLDLAGNRIGVTETVDGQSYEWTWDYDGLNRLIAEQLDASDNSLDYTSEFDSDGDGEADSTIAYAYSDSGVRISMTVDGARTVYLIDANNLTGYAQTLEEKDASGNVTKAFVIGQDVIAQAAAAALSDGSVQVAAQELLTLLYDGHGSTRALMDAAKDVIQRFAYTAYGVQLSGAALTAAASAFTSLLYSGEHFDAKTQMQYLRARWYDPSLGRFNRMDPFPGFDRSPESLHRYLYAHANPVQHVDPSGQVAVAVGAALAIPLILRVLAQAGLYIAVDKLVLDPIRFNSLLVHVRDATLLRIAQTFNGGALRTPASPSIFFSPVSPFGPLDLVSLVNNVLFQGGKALAIKSGAADAATTAAINAFLASLGVSPAAVMAVSPALARPSRQVAIIRTASSTSYLAPQYGGGISVMWDAGFVSSGLGRSHRQNVAHRILLHEVELPEQVLHAMLKLAVTDIELGSFAGRRAGLAPAEVVQQRTDHLLAQHDQARHHAQAGWRGAVAPRPRVRLVDQPFAPQLLEVVGRPPRRAVTALAAEQAADALGVLGRSMPDVQAHVVMPDYSRAAQLIDDRLTSLGHQRYLVVAKRWFEPLNQTWMNAFRSIHRQRNAELDDTFDYVDTNGFDPDKVASILLDYYLPNHREIQAVVMTSTNYLSYLAADDRFRQRMAQDLSVICFDYGKRPIDSCWPGHTPTHVACDWAAVGREGMNVLAQLAAGSRIPQMIQMPVRFVEGESLFKYQPLDPLDQTNPPLPSDAATRRNSSES